jgi:hypothetical protein
MRIEDKYLCSAVDGVYATLECRGTELRIPLAALAIAPRKGHLYFPEELGIPARAIVLKNSRWVAGQRIPKRYLLLWMVLLALFVTFLVMSVT